MPDDLPPPPVPADCDLSGLPFMPLDVGALARCDMAAKETPEACWAGLLLWCASWQQVPAGSLPDSDPVLAAAAGYGRDMRRWMKVREGALHGFKKCNDGRLYHFTVAEKALEAWLEKLAQRISSGVGNSNRWGIPFDRKPLDADMETARVMLRALNPLSRAFSKKRTAGSETGSHRDANAIPSGSRRDPKRQGQGQGQGFSSLPDGRDSNAPAPDQAPEEDPFDPKVLRKSGPDPVPVGFDDWKLTHPRVFIARTGEDGQPSDWRSLWSRCAPKDPGDPSQVEIWDRMYASLIPGLREDHWKIRLGDAAKWITEKCNLEA